MSPLSSDRKTTNIALLDRFYGIFLLVCALFLFVGVPFVFHRKTASATATIAMAVVVVLAWRMSRRGKPQKSLVYFAVVLWLMLVGLIYGGLPGTPAATAIAAAVMLAVVVSTRAGIVFGTTYMLAWLLHIVLLSLNLAPAPYFTGGPLTGWFVGAIGIWLVLLPIPELVRKLHHAASLQRAVIEATTDGILVVNSEGKVTTYNQRFVGLWRIPSADVESADDSRLLKGVVEQLADPAQFMDKVNELYAHPNQSSFDTLRFKDGRVFERYSQPQRLGHSTVGRVWSFRDVTEREAAQAEIKRLAFHDTLTQLPNRLLLSDRLEQMMQNCQRSGQHGALLFLDLDNFKPLNDTYGHSVGDLLLVEVAQRLTHAVRQIDTVARFGGDEFVVMLSHLDTDLDAARQHARKVAEKIRHDLAQPYHLTLPHNEHQFRQVQHHCTSSIGATLFPFPPVRTDDLLKQADMAMYRAKDTGRNAVHFYEHEVLTGV
jgi:diguanylate cyclase (GGDEF)-like protein